MSSIDSKIREIKYIEAQANDNQWLNQIHPLVKFLLTFFFIILTISVPKYDLVPLLLLFLYPILLMNLNGYSWKIAIKRLRIILPLVCIVGIFNPFFDKSIQLHIGSVAVTGGVLSMLTLMLKGILSVLASYLLIISTPIEKICYALRLLHLPKLFVQEVLLIYRYISVLMEEVNRMTQAYSLRAPNQKGVHYKAWGSMVGQLLLRSMDRATALYESMCIRGFQGEFYYSKKQSFNRRDLIYGIICIVALCFIRIRFIP